MKAPSDLRSTGEEAEAVGRELGDHVVDHDVGLGGGLELGIEVAADFGVGVEGGVGRAVAVLPFAEDQALGLDPHRTNSSSL